MQRKENSETEQEKLMDLNLLVPAQHRAFGFEGMQPGLRHHGA